MNLFEALLALGMLATGSVNTIVSTAADKTSAIGRSGVPTAFAHPFFQSFTMFVGEFLCMLVYVAMQQYTAWRKRRQPLDDFAAESARQPLAGSASRKPTKHPWWIFIPPTLCDFSATTLMYIGLLLTDPSVYQMLRGGMVLFTALFSVIFLKRRLRLKHYLGLLCVVGGIALVGSSSVIYNDKPKVSAMVSLVGSNSTAGASNPLVGNLLIIGAQAIVGTQFVVEETLLGRYEIHALKAVGFEGLWGVILTACLLPALQFIPYPGGKNGKVIEDSYDALVQMSNSWELTVFLLASVFSIAFFNFFGISVTKKLSAVHRTTIDSCRTLIVWAVSLILGWEKFHYMELGGFFVLVLGTCLYNEVIPFPDKWFYRVCPGCCFDRPKGYLRVLQDENETVQT